MRRLVGPGWALILPLAIVAIPALAPARQPEARQGRVILVSLDGMGTQLFREDPVSQELQALRALRARGVMAEGLVSHMPSTTANTHAALWTGAWGDVNGITSNEMPLAPRSAHPVAEHVSGYRSEGLRAEPLWIAAARQGVRTVAQQATQVYPLRAETTGAGLAQPPTILHGYQAPVVAPARWLGGDDMARVPCDRDDPPDAGVCLAWRAGPVSFRAALTTAAEGTRQLVVRVDGHPRHVVVGQAPTEQALPRGRALARHFSDGLLVDLPGQPPVMAYFRLFEISPDASSLVLFQSVLQEAVYATGEPVARADAIAFLEAAGGFVGNGKGEPWERPGVSGRPFGMGGDGTRERRYLETLELGMRQTIRHAAFLWQRHRPRLLVGYVSMPDELDHAWLGQARQDARYDQWRRWGYQLVDRAVETYVGLLEAGDHIVFVSDHGMAAVTHELRVNQLLRDAGLVALDASGRVDAARSQVLFGRNCFLVHTDEWKGGVVPATRKRAVIEKTIAVLTSARPPQGAAPIVSGVYATDAERARLGFGGPNGHDACIDVRPGYMVSTSTDGGPIVRTRARPTGEHGFLPTRPDMLGILIAAGPRLPHGGTWPRQRAIDVAPLVSDLLDISPPRDARGRSPLQR
ncbi:hypothetical protein TBR22_A02510 [Luteitalea sp. TBR-22]|uniref:alkaline phosphatase family protein n=1 Tax=Luteitalea sp. TBR-22 TaxID=2802971 RepID=UPI001AF1B6B9|nr:alkaline phosphatase family protein [Luteitalea sp. TBR-22]BCS31051.1 hypothetical protein TBR22_A02510 [Luteitalea sp. TBR-22]